MKTGLNHTLEVENMTLSYGKKRIATDLTISIDSPQIISIIGPNGAGKSTILKAFARLLKPEKGLVYLDGKNIHEMPSKEVAKVLAILPQSPSSPTDITVKELVSYGRAPYQSYLSSLTEQDQEIIQRAMRRTNVLPFANRLLTSLSGGERQRVWLAMALAQDPDILLLDEPTTFLDIHHQLDLMMLIRTLYQELNITIVMVLHDLNHASRFSERIIAVKEGKIFYDGTSDEVMTMGNLRELYQIEAVPVRIAEGEEEYRVFIPHKLC